jgi:Fic family protein
MSIPFNRTAPFNSLPKLPPSAQLETVETLKRSIAATSALTELRGVGGLIPNQAVLLRSIVLQEAKLSSEIDNIVTTNDELYRAFNDIHEKTDPNTKEVLRYEESLWHGFNQLKNGRPMSTSLFVDLVAVITETDIGIRKMSGTQIVNDKTGEVIYTPPQGEQLVRELLDNLSEQIYFEDNIDPLIKLATLHYQFEAIHPFSDGNGRTGRVINILFLIERKLLEVPVLYLSRFIIQNKAKYYSSLQAVTEEGKWQQWILFILQAIEETAIETKKLILAIKEALDDTLEKARTGMKRGYSKELIELIFHQPYTRIQSVIDAGLAGRQTASGYLKELEQLGILRSVKKGRDVLYVNQKLMDLLAS